jgi:hypothetical protein
MITKGKAISPASHAMKDTRKAKDAAANAPVWDLDMGTPLDKK